MDDSIVTSAPRWVRVLGDAGRRTTVTEGIGGQGAVRRGQWPTRGLLRGRGGRSMPAWSRDQARVEGFAATSLAAYAAVPRVATAHHPALRPSLARGPP